MWFFKKKKVTKKGGLLLSAIKELDKLKQKKFSKGSLERLNEIIRIFLSEKYNLSRALTVEELRKKLKLKKISNNIKLKLNLVIMKIRKEEYKSKRAIKKEKLDTLIEETKRAIDPISQKRSPQKQAQPSSASSKT